MAIVNSGIVFETFPDGVVVHDPETGAIVDVNERFCALFGYDRSELVGADTSLLAQTPGDYLADRDAIRHARRDGPARYEWRAETASGEPLPVEMTLVTTTRQGEELAVASVRERNQGATREQDQVTRERYQASREQGYDRYRALFENDQIIVWEMDLAGAIERVDRLAEETDDLPAYLAANPGEHEAILDRVRVTDVNEKAVEVYEADSRRHLANNLDQVMTADSIASWREIWGHVADDDTSFQKECSAETLSGNRRTILFELAVPESCWDDYSTVYLIALDITERDERQRELEAVRETRSALQASLAEPTSVETVAEAVCTELTVVEDVSYARVGVVGPTDEVEPVGEADSGRSCHDVTVPDGAVHPETHAVQTGECERVPGPADRDDVAAIVAIPATHDEAVRGVLVVHLTEQRTLSDGRLQDLFSEAASAVAREIASAERRRTLAADDRTEVTIGVETTETPLSRLAAAADATATVTAALPREDAALCYLTVPEKTEAFLAAARAREEIGGVEAVGDDDRLRLLVPSPMPSTVVAEQGGLVVESRVEATTTTVVARFPRETSYDPVLDAIAETFGEVWVSEFTTDPTEIGATDPVTALTDRQREVLAAAYSAGYFEHPRARSASAIADDLGVSRQSFTEVLRAAQRNVFATMYADSE